MSGMKTVNTESVFIVFSKTRATVHQTKLAGRKFRRKDTAVLCSTVVEVITGHTGAKIYICSTNDKLIEEKSTKGY